MAGLANKGWEAMQIKTFTKWSNMHLAKRGAKVEDLFTGFNDGIELARLLEILTDEKIKVREASMIKMIIHKQENIDTCLKFIAGKGVKLLNIGASNIQEGHRMLTLGLVWALILNLDVEEMSADQLNAKDALLLWCQKKTQGYNGVDVKNFTSSWAPDGLAFCALIHKHKPGLLDYNSLDKSDHKGNMEKAFAAAESLGICRLLDVEDMTNGDKPDEKSVMTYLFQWKKYFDKGNQSETAARRIGKLVAFTKQLEALKEEYNLKADDFAAWTQAKTTELDANRPQNNLESAQSSVNSFQNFQSKEKPPRSKEKVALENLHANIALKLKNSNRPEFQTKYSPSDLNNLWNTLVASEKTTGDIVKAELKRQKQLVDLVGRFNRLCAKLESLAKAKNDYLASPLGVDSVSSAEAKIKLHQGFTEDVGRAGPVNAEVQDLAVKIDGLDYAKKDETNARAASLAGTFSDLGSKGQARQAALEEALALEQRKNVARKEFATAAQSARAFYKQAILSVKTSGFGNSLAAVEEAKAGIDANSAQQTAKGEQQKATVTEKDAALTGMGVADNEYTALTRGDIEADHAKLLAHLGKRDAAYDQELEAARALDGKRREFAAAANELEALINNQQAAMEADGDEDAKLAAVDAAYNEAEVAALLAKVNELDADVKRRLTSTDNAHTKLSASDLANLAASLAQQKEHHVASAHESKAAKARQAEQDAAREAKIKQNNESLDFANAANALLTWASSVQDNVGQDLSTLTNAAAVAAQRDLYNQSAGAREAQEAALAQLGSKADAMQASGNNDFGGVDLADVRATFTNAIAVLDVRDEALDAADNKQASDSVLRQAFVDAGNALSAFIGGLSGRVAEEKGDLEEQLSAVADLRGKLNDQGSVLLQKVEEANNGLNDAAITADEVTDMNAESLSAQFNATSDAIKSRMGAINDAIAAKHASQIPPEKVAEFKQTFDHFDKNKNGVLSQLEFKGCLMAMGDEKTDDQMAALMVQLQAGDGKLPFNSFMNHMITATQDNDSEDEILAAFKIITNDQPTITADQIRSVMGAEEAGYLIANLPAVDGGFDYTSWTGKAFGK